MYTQLIKLYNKAMLSRSVDDLFDQSVPMYKEIGNHTRYFMNHNFR